MHTPKLSIVLAGGLLAILTACGDSTVPAPVAKKEPEKLEPVTGQSALFKMYSAARTWAPDSQVLELHSTHLNDVKDGAPGTAPAWEAVFVSEAKAKSRSYTFSIVEGEGNLHKGAFAGSEDGWTGSKGNLAAARMEAVKVDSDTAYKTAIDTPASKAVAYDKKNPGKPITILLEKTNKYPDPVWRIIWGTSVTTSDFSVLIDASTGAFLEIEH